MTGPRVAEFVSIKAEHYFFEEDMILIEKGKGGRSRYVPIIPIESKIRPTFVRFGQLRRIRGSPGDISAHGDYTGDGKADVAFFRPTTGEWFVIRSEDNSFFAFPWGVPGDYDGDGVMDAAVWRQSQNNTWFINGSTSGFQSAPFGQG